METFIFLCFIFCFNCPQHYQAWCHLFNEHEIIGCHDQVGGLPGRTDRLANTELAALGCLPYDPRDIVSLPHPEVACEMMPLLKLRQFGAALQVEISLRMPALEIPEAFEVGLLQALQQILDGSLERDAKRIAAAGGVGDENDKLASPTSPKSSRSGASSPKRGSLRNVFSPTSRGRIWLLLSVSP